MGIAGARIAKRTHHVSLTTRDDVGSRRGNRYFICTR